MNKILPLFVAAFTFLSALALGGYSQARASASSAREWKAAKYKGLIVGSSTRGDMYRILGPPKRRDIFKEDHAVWYIYEGKGELPGELTIIVDAPSKRIVEMYLTPSKLSRQEAIKHFGPNYAVTRYDFCPGFEAAESAPIYESADGAATYLEYRDRGIAILIGDQDSVYQVMYVNKPIGRTSKRMCNRGVPQDNRGSNNKCLQQTRR